MFFWSNMLIGKLLIKEELQDILLHANYSQIISKWCKPSVKYMSPEFFYLIITSIPITLSVWMAHDGSQIMNYLEVFIKFIMIIWIIWINTVVTFAKTKGYPHKGLNSKMYTCSQISVHLFASSALFCSYFTGQSRLSIWNYGYDCQIQGREAKNCSLQVRQCFTIFVSTQSFIVWCKNCICMLSFTHFFQFNPVHEPTIENV